MFVYFKYIIYLQWKLKMTFNYRYKSNEYHHMKYVCKLP